ncbi:uncharacterized protein LOC124402280 isoform X2 [Silurus meridionalis]|uniref:uncharacterized protein LOC124402280 isoform X2 n=1 Tax=Silurus meridionalis TaxID=175797 RepID=UPI001EEA0E9B|nr:uncharacterized protein LOC124402280 isoform X2 [Silurus meridionalis]
MPGLKVCYCRDHSLQRCFHMRSWWDVNTDSQDLRKLPSNLCHLLYRCKKFMMESLTFQKSNLAAETTEVYMNSSFPPPANNNRPVYWPYTFISLSIIVQVGSLPLNIYVLWLIVKNQRNGTASEFFSINLCYQPSLVSVLCLCGAICGSDPSCYFLKIQTTEISHYMCLKL